MNWIYRFLILAGVLMGTAAILVAVFISPIAKSILEKYSRQWLGRQLTVSEISVDLFSGNFTAHGLVVFEANEKDVFIQCDSVAGNFGWRKLFRREIEFNKLHLTGPVIHLWLMQNRFSYDDVVRHFSAPRDTSRKREPMDFRLSDFAIEQGTLYFNNKNVGRIDTFIQVTFSFPVLSNQVPAAAFHTELTSIAGGKVNLDFNLQVITADYDFHLRIDRFNLQKYYAALRTMLRVGSLKGHLTGDLRVSGSFKKRGAVAASGVVAIDRVVINDYDGIVFTSLRRFVLDIDTVNVAQNIFNFNKIMWDVPYFRFDKYINGNNLSRMLVSRKRPTYHSDSTASVVETAPSRPLDYTNIFTLIWSYSKFIVTNFTISNYSADSFLIRSGHIIYNDYSLEDRFTYDVRQIRVQSGSVSSHNPQVAFAFGAVLNYQGELEGAVTSSPDFRHMKAEIVIDNIKVPDFNAYTRHYLATPFFDGLLGYTAHIAIDTGYLVSKNNFNIVNLLAGKKIKAEPVYDWPVRLTISLLKDVDGNIALDVPIEGNLRDPDYHLGNVVWQVIENLFGKAKAAPAKFLSAIFNENEEDLKVIPFDYLQRDFEKQQTRKLNMVIRVLKHKPELNVQLMQLTDTIAEREALALHEAKKRYYTERVSPSSADSLSEKNLQEIADIQNKDSLFNQYLNEKLEISSAQAVSTEEKAIRLIGFKNLEDELQALMRYRNQQVLDYLTADKSIAAERINVVNNFDPLKSVGLPQPRYLITYWAEE
jgi:hypothetical protein